MRKYAVALAFLLVVSGCGGSSGTATPVTTVGSAATQAPTTTAIPTTTPVPTTVPLGACYWELREEEIRKKASTGLVLDGEPIDCSYQNLGNVDLSDHTRLPKVDFEGANLSGADLSGAWFGGANLRTSNLSAANLVGVKFTGADLAGAILDGADLTRATLNGADLREADLRGANLSGADFSGVFDDLAHPDGADLREADLRGVNLSGVDFTTAKLGGAILEEVCFDSSTHWPSPWFSPPTNNCSSNESDVVAVDFWPVVDETTCVSPGTGVMNCLVGIGDYAGQPVNCLSLGVMGWRCIAYVPD